MRGARAAAVSARLDSELSELDDAEAEAMRAELGVAESGLTTVIREAFALLDLISFFTAGEGKEARAHAIARGTPARRAAGSVHTDIERGFVAAEVVPWNELVDAGRIRAGPRAGEAPRGGPRLRDAGRRRGHVPLHAVARPSGSFAVCHRAQLAEIVRSMALPPARRRAMIGV